MMPSLPLNKSSMTTVLLIVAFLVILSLLVAQFVLHIDLVSLVLHHQTQHAPLAMGYGGY